MRTERLPHCPSSPSTASLIERYKADPESVYNTWFIGGEARLKAFRAIRRGVRDTVEAPVRLSPPLRIESRRIAC